MKRVTRIVSISVLFLLLPIAGFGAGPSEVADAAMRGDKAAVQKLVEQHADVNAPQADGATALHWAVFRSDKEMVDLLIRAGANAKAANREGATPLWLASVNGDAAIIEALIKGGADPNEKLPLGRTPLMVASRTGNVDAMKVLIDHGADVNAKETLRGTTPLMWAADEGHAPAIKLLIEHGADIKAQSDLAERGRGPALGKSNDPRKAVAAQGAALAAGKASPPLGAHRGDANGIGGPAGAGAAAGRPAAGGRGRSWRRPRRRVPLGGRRGCRWDRRRRRGCWRRPARTSGREGWRGSDAAGLCGPLQRSRFRQSPAGSGSGREPGHRVRLEPLAGRDAKPVLQARSVSAGPRRRRESRQQRRVDAALSCHRQPQYRIRRLSRPQGRHGSSGFHQAPSGQRRQCECPDEGQHRDAYGFHQPVAG